MFSLVALLAEALVVVSTFLTLVVAAHTALLLSVDRWNVGRAVQAAARGSAKVSIVIAAKNEASVLPGTLQNIIGAGYPSEDVEVVLVLDHRDEETIEACAPYAGKVRILRSEGDSKPQALNHALREVHSDFLLLLDADSIIERGAVASLLSMMGDGVAAVSGDPYPTNLGQGVLPELFSLECALYSELSSAKQRLGLFVQAPGFYSLMRRSSVLDAGGWREDSLAEDYYISLRLYTRGGRILVSESRVGIQAPARLSSFVRQRLRWYRGTMDVLASGLGDVFRAGPKKGTDLVVSMLAAVVPGLFPFAVLGLAFWPLTFAVLLLFIVAFQVVGAAFSTKGVPAGTRASIVALTFPYFLLQSLISLVALLTFIFRIKLPWMRTEKSGTGEVPAGTGRTKESVSLERQG